MSAALVAVTKHVPDEPAVKEVPETVQLEAVPVEAANVTLPEPEPPEVVSVNAVPKVPVVEETVSVACAALAKVIVVWEEETVS